MTSLVPELADLPPRLRLDGELVAFGDDKLPSFPRLCERMLHGSPGSWCQDCLATGAYDPLEEQAA